LADFYEAVFGWSVRHDADKAAFEDGTGDVIGHFMTEHEIAGDAGIRPYVFVESLDETLGKVGVNGGAAITPPFPEGDLRVATFRDPAGNVVGIWERAGRG
jgi:predicted enzyme related to lactoylglutathione lyase